VESWEVFNNRFTPSNFETNGIVNELKLILSEFKQFSFSVRGSILEEIIPHPNADIDLFLIYHTNTFDYSILTQLNYKLSYLKRYIDWHIFNPKELEAHIPNALLYSVRSHFLCGPLFTIECPVINDKFFLTHWKAYDPYFVPDVMYSTQISRVSALKNLTRCFGLIRLKNGGFFTRNINECLSYVRDNHNVIYSDLIIAWENADLKIPLQFKNIKDYLKTCM
jgi:hypothetical protein